VSTSTSQHNKSQNTLQQSKSQNKTQKHKTIQTQQKTNTNSTINTDVDVDKFRCSVCCFSFKYVHDLIQHINGHVDGKYGGDIDSSIPEGFGYIPCDICHRFYAARGGVNRHKKKCAKVLSPSSVPSSPDYSDLEDERGEWLPSLHEVFSSYCPTVQYVYKEHRQAWGRVLCAALKVVRIENSVSAWIRLLMLPKCVLATKKRAGVRNRGDNLNITQLCERWEKGELEWLWNRSQRLAPSKSSSLPPNHSTRLLQAAIQHTRHGRLSKACATLSSSGLAPDSPETFHKLQEKHPQAHPPPDCSGKDHSANHPPMQLEPNFEIMRILRSFAKNVGTDGTNFRVQYLLDAAEASLPDSYVMNLRGVINLLLSGTVIEEVREFLAGARLTALVKGDSDVRPIAAGNIFRRIASKCVCSLIHQRARELFRDVQVGVAYRGGAEHVVHSMRNIIHRHWNTPHHDFMVLKVDFRNAFNVVSRSAMLEQVVALFPDLYAWVHWCYGDSSLLFYNDKSVRSCVGVQQGDPLGPFLFSLVLHRISCMIGAELPHLSLHKWYLDDGALAGDVRDIMVALKLIERHGPELGLKLNLLKCEIYSPSAANFSDTFDHDDLGGCFLPHDLKLRYTSPNFSLLGAPIGDAAFCSGEVAKLRKSNQLILTRLCQLNDLQCALLLLRFCVCYCKCVYLSRTTPPGFIQDELRLIDAEIRSCFERMSGLQVTDVAWSQAQLPVSDAGLGLRSSARHCAAAFISSHRQALPGLLTDHLYDAVNLLCDQLGVESDDYRDTILDMEQKPPTQRLLSDKLDKRDYDALLRHLASSKWNHIRLISCSAPRACSWLQAIPARGPFDQCLTSNEMQVALMLLLGLSLANPSDRCRFCKVLLDALGHHHLTCHHGSFVVCRHNQLRDLLFRFFKLAGMSPQKEQGSSFGDLTRPADVLVSSYSAGKPGAIDVTAISPLTHSALAAGDGIDAVEVAAAEKHKNNDEKCSELGWVCIPVAVDSYGRWGREAHSLFMDLSERLSLSMSVSQNAALNQIYHSLGIVLARQNARAILARRVFSEKSLGVREIQLQSSSDCLLSSSSSSSSSSFVSSSSCLP
jgi:hypothetical protein